MSGPGFDVAIYEAGARDNFPDPAKAAHEFARLLAVTPRVGLTIGGYDEDPRELFDIPEAMGFLRLFMLELPRFLPGGKPAPDFFDQIIGESRALLMLAAGVIDRSQINVQTWDQWHAEQDARRRKGEDPWG